MNRTRERHVSKVDYMYVKCIYFSKWFVRPYNDSQFKYFTFA